MSYLCVCVFYYMFVRVFRLAVICEIWTFIIMIIIMITIIITNSFEVIKTSGSLHSLRPQDKRLHTPRTTDYRHTRQDRFIQTELISTFCKECHKTESLWNHTTTDHKEGEQLEDRRNVGESSCNFGDGTGHRVQSLMFMMMMTYLKQLKICFPHEMQADYRPDLFYWCVPWIGGTRYESITCRGEYIIIYWSFYVMLPS